MRYLKKIIYVLLILILLIIAFNFYQRYQTFKKIREAENLILIESPKPYEKLKNPILIKGKARGFFFFEATFPVKIIDIYGNILVSDYIETKEDWMTENFISFEKYFDVNFGKTKKGFVILEKANATGLKEHQLEISIPVYFP